MKGKGEMQCCRYSNENYQTILYRKVKAKYKSLPRFEIHYVLRQGRNLHVFCLFLEQIALQKVYQPNLEKYSKQFEGHIFVITSSFSPLVKLGWKRDFVHASPFCFRWS